ncbi:hypothetical protein Tco_0796542 [Tanacetum coccineum]
MYVDAPVKPKQAPEDSSGKRLKATAKVTKSGMKKQPAKGLETLSEIALSEAEQMKLAIVRSKTQLHNSEPSGSGAHEGNGVTPGVPDVPIISHASGSGAHEGTGVSPGVPDAPTYRSDDEEIPWKSSDEDDDDEVNVSEHEDDDDDERTESDNDGDDFVHPKFSTHNDEAKQDEEVNEEDSFDPRSSSVTSSFISNMLNPRPDTSIDSIFTHNTEATSLVDVPVTTIVEPPLVSATTLPPPSTHLITHMQQTPVPTPTTVQSSSL